MDEGCPGKLGLHSKAGLGSGPAPDALREEVKKARTEGEEIPPVPGVFHQDELAAGDQNARDFQKQTSALVSEAQLMRSKDTEGRVEGAGAKGQIVETRGRGGNGGAFDLSRLPD